MFRLKRNQLIIIFLYIVQFCQSNISPYLHGTKTGEVLTSSGVDITREKIYINLNDNNSLATFNIEYYVNIDRDGIQIPLLFYAIDFKSNFCVTVDGKDVQIKNVPSDIKDMQTTPFRSFAKYFDYDKNVKSSYSRLTDNSNNWGVILRDFIYFEASLTKGEHILKVSYDAQPNIRRTEWLNEYQFLYSLVPARYWKSFGSLDIVIDATKMKSEIKTNLVKPNTGRLDSISSWQFDKLPNDILIISYKPKINWFSKLLIGIHPVGFSIILFIMLAFLHFILLKRYDYNVWIVFWGGIVNTFLTLFGYMYFFDFIDCIIGKDASRYHGYTFFAILLFPFIFFPYFLLMRAIVRKIKNISTR